MKKIIIIEDDTDTLDLIEYILREHGYAVIKANRLVSVAEIISLTPHLVILDFQTPYRLGSDLCLEIKRNPDSKHLPVILYSANVNLKNIARDSMADAYLEKPFDGDGLIQIVKETIL